MPYIELHCHSCFSLREGASTPEELTALMQKEIPRWGDLVKRSGAQAN